MFLVCSNPTPLQVIWSFNGRLLQPCCNMTLNFIQALHLPLTIIWSSINPPIPTSLSCVIPPITMGLNFVTICIMLTCKLWCNCYSPSCIVVANHSFINLTFAFIFSWPRLYSISYSPLVNNLSIMFFFFLYAFWFPNFICSFLFNYFPL